jgi:hypothetical protein
MKRTVRIKIDFTLEIDDPLNDLPNINILYFINDGLQHVYAKAITAGVAKVQTMPGAILDMGFTRASSTALRKQAKDKVTTLRVSRVKGTQKGAR